MLTGGLLAVCPLLPAVLGGPAAVTALGWTRLKRQRVSYSVGLLQTLVEKYQMGGSVLPLLHGLLILSGLKQHVNK